MSTVSTGRTVAHAATTQTKAAQTHTPGPWNTGSMDKDGRIKILAPCGPVSQLEIARALPADANRIVACVNACEGIAHPVHCGPDWRTMHETERARLAACQALLADARGALDAVISYPFTSGSIERARAVLSRIDAAGVSK